VAQNIAFGLQHLPKPQRDRQVNEQLAQSAAALETAIHTRCPVVSGRLLARALAIQPEVLLLDEPFSALDTHLRSQMEKLIETLSTYKASRLCHSQFGRSLPRMQKSFGSFRRQNRCLRFQRKHL